MKQRIAVSPEMLAFVGAGRITAAGWPPEPLLLRFFGLGEGATPSLAIVQADEDEAADTDTLILVVAAAACRRIFGTVPAMPNMWHLPVDLRTLVIAIRDCAGSDPVRETLRVAKSIELLCGVFECLDGDALVPLAGAGMLAEMDVARVAAARRMIEARWHEKLTLDMIARACGLSRGKLARDFRAVYDCSVGDALVEQRLAGAQRMLKCTDLPIKAIGYRCGYLNNASFARAFSRHVGVAPNQFRAARIAA